jgi:metal-responsive CopG/Arc/MetJ family transcriptional regulator
MQIISIEIPEALNAKLVEVARRRGATEAQLISEALQDYLARQEQRSAADSFAARAAEILDSPSDESGPTDLSTNREHLEGYGRW